MEEEPDFKGDQILRGVVLVKLTQQDSCKIGQCRDKHTSPKVEASLQKCAGEPESSLVKEKTLLSVQGTTSQAEPGPLTPCPREFRTLREAVQTEKNSGLYWERKRALTKE